MKRNEMRMGAELASRIRMGKLAEAGKGNSFDTISLSFLSRSICFEALYSIHS